MADSATIVAASLDSSQLEQSINKLVATVASKTKEMADNFTKEVGRMEQAVKNLGNIKIDSGGAADGGSSRRAKLFSQEGEVIQRNNQIAKEYNTTLDQQAAAIRKASQVSVRTGDAGSIRNADTLQTMNIQLDLLRERLREARNQYSSFVALASHATTTGDKGLYQFATEGVHKYGDEVRTLIPQIRGLQNAIQQMGDVIAPQGHTIQNYVNSLQKTNPELAQLNEQFKKGQSELQNQSTSYSNATQSAHQYTEEIRKQAQAIRESQQYQKGERVVIATKQDGTEIVAFSEKRLSLEEQIINAKKAVVEETAKQKKEEEETVQATRLAGEELKKIYQDQKAVNEEINKRANGIRNGGTTPFQSYDNLRQSIASVLGIQEQQVKMANAEKDSYNQLSSTLKQLSQAYYALGKSDRNSDQGKALVASMHEVERAMQRIKAQAARPVSLESIIGINGKGGLSEKTLDDIAYKMQRLSSLRSGLNVETQQTEIRTVNAEYDRLKKKMDEVMQKNQSMIASNNALGRSWNYMKNRLAFYFTVGASTQFIKNLIEVRSQYEMNERALGILINSAERGTQIFNELSQMALVSPYTLIELSNAAKQLTAYDIAAKDVVETTRRLADMASAVGVPMERLTYALGQIKAYGYLNSRDARMFANAGIPLVRELSKYYTELEGKMVSVGDVYDRMKKKAIDFNDVMSVVTKMTDEGGKFFDFQAKMADTLKVRLANLTLAWNNMLNDIGKSEQGVLTTGIGLLKDFFLQWKSLSRAVENLAIGFGIVKTAQLLYYGVVMGTNKAIALEAVLGDKLSQKLRGLTSSMNAAKMASSTLWVGLATMVASAVVEIVRGNEAMKEFNKTLRENAKNTYADLEKFKEQYSELRDSLYKTTTDSKGASITTPQDINIDEAKKAWEAVREQIELSSHASNEYIGRLLQVNNVSERLRQGFDILDDIQSVSAAVKELGDNAIKIERDWSGWWNLWLLPDGTIGNLKDAHMWLGKIEEKYGSIEKARKAAFGEEKDPTGVDKRYVEDAERFLENYEKELGKFRKDIQSTKDSVLSFISLQGWTGNVNKIDEAFKQITDNLIQQNQLDPQKAFTLQLEMEEARTKATMQAYSIRIKDEQNALKAARDENEKAEIQSRINALNEEYDFFLSTTDKQRVYWKDFTKYLKEQHLSETTAMFRGMDAEQIKSLNFQEGKYADWVKRMVTSYAKSHKLSYDEAFNYLKNWVASANQWSIFIPLTISTEDQKTVIKSLEEADATADKAWKDMQRLDKEISRLRKKGAKEATGDGTTGIIDLNTLSEDDKRLTQAIKERAAAQKDYDKAIAEGGHSKKEDAAATKAQKAAESELQKALKDELQLIDKVRSQYKKLTDAGATDGEALAVVTNQFANSLAHVNKVLGKNGIPLFDISKFAGTDNPHALLDMLKLQLDSAKIAKNIKPEEIKELEVKYSDIKVDAEAYDLTKITKGLNNELDRLKDEYELAVSLDADPELGNMFADWMGIDVSDLPKTASEYAERASKILNNKLKDLGAKTELPSVLDITDDDMRAFEENKTFTDKQLELVKKAVEAARSFQRKETEDRIKDWDKLLEKYAEYETKVNKIQNDAVKERVTFAQQFGNDEEKSLALNLQTQILAATDPQEKQKLIQQLQELVKSIAGDDKTKLNIVTSINTGETRNLAKASFEEFQKSPEWITATGELSGMTNKAINGLIASLEKYKKSAKNLDPKQIKNINNALKNLYKEQRKNNPFGAITNMLDKAKERMADVLPEMESIMSDIIALEKEIGDGEATEGQIKTLEELKERWQTLSEIGEVSAGEWVESLMSVYGAIKGAIGLFDDLAKAIGGTSASDIEKIFGILDKAGQGAQIGAAFGGYGAIIGAIVGGLTGVITTFADELSGNADITSGVEKSARAVKRLELTYIDLERAINKAYGSGVVGAKQAMAAAKELELAELERQLRLEQSRDSKHREDDRIIELQKQIKELRYEIEDTVEEITNDLMGTDAYSFAENLVSSMIDAFKQGEDYMKTFEESFDKMVDNLIMKAIVGRVVGEYMDKVWDSVEENIQARSKTQADELAKAKDEVTKLESIGRTKAWAQEYFVNGNYAHMWEKYGTDAYAAYDAALELAKKQVEAAEKNYDAANQIQKSDIDSLISELAQIKPELGEKLKEILGDYYKFGESSETQLSALQQGIQGITENTAGALEAYMNGVSQQVYYQSDLLTQIRDAVVGFDLDVQVATMSQILLQLQSSYTVQMSIQGILEGWSSTNGLAVRVEMVE